MTVQKQIAALTRRVKELEELTARRVPSNDAPMVERIFDACAKVYCVTVTQMKGLRRVRQISDARAMAMYFMRTHTELTTEAVAALFDGEKTAHKHHSSVVWAERKVRQWLQEREPSAVKMADAIAAEITSSGKGSN